MGYLRSGTFGARDASALFITLTVPAGTVAGDRLLLIGAGSTDGGNLIPTSFTPTTSGSGTFSVLQAPYKANNQWVAILTGTGFVAGDTITVTLNSTFLWGLHHLYYDRALTLIGSLYDRNGTSLSTVVIPTATCLNGQTILAVSSERTTADGTTVVSRSNSGGATVTARYHQEEATYGDTSVSVGDFTSTSTATGATTITYSGPSGNGYGVHLAEALPVSTSQPGHMIGDDILQTVNNQQGWY
jgi:hypothetical protein